MEKTVPSVPITRRYSSVTIDRKWVCVPPSFSCTVAGIGGDVGASARLMPGCGCAPHDPLPTADRRPQQLSCASARQHQKDPWKPQGFKLPLDRLIQAPWHALTRVHVHQVDADNTC